MSDDYSYLAIILLLILLNGVFAMSEIAILSARKTKLAEQASKGDLKSKMVLQLLEDPNKILSTVQVGITLIGILAGAFGGATLTDDLANYLNSFPFLSGYAESLAIAIVVIGITYFSLVLGELVPKRLAINNPELIARSMAKPMKLLSILTAPMVKLLSASTNLFLFILRVKQNPEAPVTEDEIKVMLKEGAQAGTFEEVERDMMESIFKLGDRTVEDIMTPRPDIEWIDLENGDDEVVKMLTTSICSRFPVAEGDLDNIKGIVQVKDLIDDALAGKKIDLKKHMLKPLLVPENTDALKLLELFKKSKMHIALIVNEYGGIEGLVTLNDILEEIVGDIPALDDIAEESPIVERQDGTLLIDGTLSIEDFEKYFGLSDLMDEEDDTFQTVGGLVINKMEKIPNVGDTFEAFNLRFEIIDMDGNRVDKIMVEKLPGFNSLENSTGE